MENKLWIARDKSGELYLYNEKPEFYNDCKVWFAGGILAKLDNNLFPDLTWYDGSLEVMLTPFLNHKENQALPMKPKEFFDLVADMRKAQKEYFKTPASAYKVKQDALSKSKKLEKQVDDEITRVEKILVERMQRTLDFDGNV